MRSAIVAIWRRCRATASRKDRRIAQVSGIRAREVLERRVGPGEVGVLWGGRGTWLVSILSDGCMLYVRTEIKG